VTMLRTASAPFWHPASPRLHGRRWPSRWVSQFMNSIAAQIGGGTSNMQRNVIAEKRLHLPRDIRG